MHQGRSNSKNSFVFDHNRLPVGKGGGGGGGDAQKEETETFFFKSHSHWKGGFLKPVFVPVTE